MRDDIAMTAGRWLVAKWRTRLLEADGDYFTVAKQLRKQGFPIKVALALLIGKGPLP